MSIRFIQPWNGYQVGQVATLSNEAALIAGGIARDSEEVDGPFYGTGIMAEMNPTGTALYHPVTEALLPIPASQSLLSVTTVSLAALTSVATGGVIPFDTVLRDDLSLSASGGRINLPLNVTQFRFIYQVSIYQAVKDTTFRKVTASIYINSIAATMADVGVKPMVIDVSGDASAASQTPVLYFCSPLIDVSQTAIGDFGPTLSENWIQIALSYDAGASGVQVSAGSSLSLECYTPA